MLAVQRSASINSLAQATLRPETSIKHALEAMRLRGLVRKEYVVQDNGRRGARWILCEGGR